MNARKLFKGEEHRYFDLYSFLKDVQYMCLCVSVIYTFETLRHGRKGFMDFIQLEVSLTPCSS